MEWKLLQNVVVGRYDAPSRYDKGAWLVTPARGPSAQTKTPGSPFGVLMTIPAEDFVSGGQQRSIQGCRKFNMIWVQGRK